MFTGIFPFLSAYATREQATLDTRVVATRDLLARFHTLGPCDLHRLATNLGIIADRLDLMAEQKEDGEPGD